MNIMLHYERLRKRVDILKALIPRYFIKRVLSLLVLGTIAFSSVFAHLMMETSNTANLRGLMIMYLIAFLGSPVYLSIFYPLREHQHYPNKVSHPVAGIIITLHYAVSCALYQEAISLGADPYVASILLILVAGHGGGVSLLVSLPLMAIANVFILVGSFSTFGPYFSIYLISGQLVMVVLTKSLVNDFKRRGLLELSLAELNATQGLLRDIIERETKIEIARNLHDEIGHLITVIIVNLNRVVKLQGDSSPSILLDTQQLSKQLMNEIRKAVLQLRSDDAVNLRDIINEFSRTLTRPNVNAKFVGFDGVCSPRIGEVIFRACQESVTNSLRHSNANNVYITITKNDSHFQVDITDDGSQSDNWSFGNGLSGLKERTENLFGTFFAESDGYGFKISMRLPC